MDTLTGLTPAEAVALVSAQAPYVGSERVPLRAALGRILAEDVASLCDHPGVDNSALDGYACRVQDTRGASESAPVRLRVVGEAPAGRPFGGAVGTGEAVRVFTGAAVPKGSDGIVPVEACRHDEGDRSLVTVLRPAREADIRRRGQDVVSGQVYLHRGRRLDAGAIALAAGMGHAAVPVARRPRVGVLTTGDEVVTPGRPLQPGQVYDSNAAAIVALGSAAGADMLPPTRVGDDTTSLERAVDELAGTVDLLITSGGVSMGRYDRVRDLLFTQGEVRFWKVAMKPGGPALFGSLGELPVLGLPGNPVSSMVVFLVLARAWLDAALGRSDPPPYHHRRAARAGTLLKAAVAKESLPRVRLEQRPEVLVASALPQQSSGVLRSMSDADALAVVPPGPDVAAGAAIEIIPLRPHLR